MSEQPKIREVPTLSPRAIGFLVEGGATIELPDERDPNHWTPAGAHELAAIERMGHARLVVARVLDLGRGD